jgi:hypothetical protein
MSWYRNYGSDRFAIFNRMRDIPGLQDTWAKMRDTISSASIATRFPRETIERASKFAKEQKIRCSEAIRRLVERSRSGRGETILLDRPPTAQRMLPAMRRMTRLRLNASPPSPKHRHEIPIIGRKHETKGHGGQVTNDPAGHLAGAPIESSNNRPR